MRRLSKILVAMFAVTFLSDALHLHDASQNYISYLQDQQNTVKNKLDALSQKLLSN